MSDIKRLVVFLLAVHVGFWVMQAVEIAPGLYLNPGPYGLGFAGVDPVSTIQKTEHEMNVTATLFLSLVQNWENPSNPNVVSDTLGVVSSMFLFGHSGAGDLLSVLFYKVELVLNLVVSVFFIIIWAVGTLFLVLFYCSWGAPLFYQSLFAIIDPGLGTVLGVVFGFIQAIIITWGVVDMASPGGRNG